MNLVARSKYIAPSVKLSVNESDFIILLLLLPCLYSISLFSFFFGNKFLICVFYGLLLLFVLFFVSFFKYLVFV